jgi:hypothetical protein
MGERSRKRAEALYSFPAVVKRYEELWSELSLLASGLRLAKPAISFDSARYFDCFKGHASSVLADDSPLNLTPLGQEVSDAELQSLLHPRVSAGKAVNFDLVRRALHELRAAASLSSGNGKPAGIRLGELTELLLRNSAFHPDYVRRNVMWLVKHGLVKPEAQIPRQAITNNEVDETVLHHYSSSF